MKTTLHFVKVLTLLTFFLLLKGNVSAQDYLFTNYTSFTGTNLQIGASYLYTNVKPGVDAMVTITNFTGGLTISNIDGGGGFTHALQPVIVVPAYSNGYAEFRIDFLVAGTSNPSVQDEVPISPIDVDGQMYSGMPLYEFDEIDVTNGYTIFQMTGGQLTMTTNGQWVRGKNNAAVDYPGIDTAQKSVMFSTINGNVSSVYFRVGAHNTSATAQSRLRSLYFKRFIYSSQGVLEVNPLKTFIGSVISNNVQLQYEFADASKVSSVIIEKSHNGKDFTSLSENRELNPSNSFIDHSFQTSSFYRLKIKGMSGTITYSNILRFELGQKRNDFKVFPTIVEDQITAQIYSDHNKTISLQFVDYSGRIVHTQNQQLSKGINSFQISGLSNLKSGNYIVIARNGEQIYQQKIIKH
jgi:hypothetical protein